MVSHPFLTKEPIEKDFILKKQSSGVERTNYKLEKEPSDRKEEKTIVLGNQFDKDEEFDLLLKDFKNYQVGSNKK